tara:strand:- start:360 stop:977 length:618 start_codon:yes stop_codon:yes gene_type:complete
MPYLGNDPNSGVFKTKRFTYVYTAGINQGTFSGVDDNGETLFLPTFGEVLVFLDGVLVPPTSYSQAEHSVTLTTSPAAGTEVQIITELESALIDSFTRTETINAIDNRMGAWYNENSDFTAIVQGKYFIDTSLNTVTVTLPQTPDFGNEVKIVDIKGNSKNNPITVDRNGHLIMGIAENLVINSNRAALGLVYFDTSEGWVLTDK